MASYWVAVVAMFVAVAGFRAGSATEFCAGSEKDATARTRTQMRSGRTGVPQPVGHSPSSLSTVGLRGFPVLFFFVLLSCFDYVCA